MTLKEQPERLLVVGAGAIGMEFAYFYNAFGTEVTVLEMEDRVLPGADPDVSEALGRAFEKQGITLRTGVKTTALEREGESVQLTLEPKEGDAETLSAERALVATGVQGNVEGLFDEEGVGVHLQEGHIRVDRVTYETSQPGIYAVGDVSGTPWLAHKASEEAILCVERIAGHRPLALDYDNVPGCVYCHPQAAHVGLTEAEAKERGHGVRVGRFPFQASGKAQAEGDTEGFVKILADEKTGELLGGHMVGENVTEMIHEIAMARRPEATVEELIATVHAHPTLSEAIHEAALGVEGRAIHI
jgi:dihydrolipoamide dehydrogenase